MSAEVAVAAPDAKLAAPDAVLLLLVTLCASCGGAFTLDGPKDASSDSSEPKDSSSSSSNLSTGRGAGAGAGFALGTDGFLAEESGGVLRVLGLGFRRFCELATGDFLP